jgi:uncharacterized membrane protein
MPSHSERARRLVVGSLLAATGFCVAILVARVLFTDTVHFSFLGWNLLLAWIPFGAALVVYDGRRVGRGKWHQIGFAALWLLFFPNAPYIVTDFIHLGRFGDPVPLWVDALLLTAFAWTGLLLGLVSLYLIHTAARAALGTAKAWATVAAAVILGGFGIYLGRFQRWNSWDILSEPGAVLADVVAPLMNPLSNPKPLAVTVGFACFLTVAYLVVYAVAEFGANERRP